MTVRIRMKRLGRKARPFYRVCVVDSRTPRDGRVIEELGHYDPLVKETDARAILKGERIAYWLGVGAQPSEKVAVLIKKYGAAGTHLEAQRAALSRLGIKATYTPPVRPEPEPPPAPEAPAAEEQTDAPAEEGAELAAEASADDNQAASGE